ncbi:MAG: TIGR00282 family metallophosphoesterase [Candidatus Vecturithrix sp.]|nr:TIGR00282 family metallophosphoesterase [Candidatus Vecturithrix sp.]
MNVTLLFIGDIVGKAGRRAVKTLLQSVVHEFQVDIVIANGENAAGGVGITPKIAEDLFSSGIHVLTSGNHVWQKKEIIEYIQHERRLIRPLNFPPETPGMGSCVVHTDSGQAIAVLNLLGRVFMDGFSCPFRAADQEIHRLKDSGATVIIDFHAEATSEKQALAWYLDGKVGAVLGTHTHVQTADEHILPQGTAYITDVGMTGAMDSVIGVETEQVIQKFLTYMPVRFESALLHPCLHGVVVTLDTARKVAVRIARLRRPLALTEEKT